ncbi:MAG: hypothetical protein H6767_02375 [Candidatus Peribacteria bacterium]|nr:MAG: hypothetical protein H6767_02375 [Candidatus Peribacteria bacterium]
MKQIIAMLALLGIICLNVPFQTGADEELQGEKYFVVTAYYSPLPDQKYYLKGNYEDEIRLNGHGVRGASGKGVFEGMLAAPQGYNFGTKIYLEGLGIGSVEDRGGAIVTAGNRGYAHDRIDVWMGYGEEGLRRALYWGKRTVKGRFMATDTKTTIDVEKVPSPLWAADGLQKIPQIFSLSIGKGSSAQDIRALQSLFIEAGLYHGEVDGVYNYETMSVVFEFQKRQEIVNSEYDVGAGYWGKKTREAFLEAYLSGDLVSEELEVDQETATEDMPDIFDRGLENKEEIAYLQKVLTEMSLYDGEIDGVYNSVKNSVLNYQLKYEVIDSDGDAGAGYYGPKTRASLKEKLLEYYEMKHRQEELEARYKVLEEAANAEAKEKLQELGSVSYGQTSPSVRELQLLLKDFGFFDYDDTAIF